MKYLSVFCYLICSISMVACGDGFRSNVEDSRPDVLTKNREERVGSLGYKFDGTNSKDKKCTTGVHNFDSLKLMCINIQDPVRNNDCALDQRIKKFISDCSPKGYSFFESKACEAFLLDKNTQIDPFGIFNPKFILSNAKYCVGYNADGSALDFLSDQTMFYKEVALSVEMKFVPKNEESDKNSSYSWIRMHKVANAKSTKMMDDIIFKSGAMVTYGFTLDGAYKYLVRCGGTWACP